MTYIMGHANEAERIRSKTQPVLIRHHLDWAGLHPGDSFLDVGCATGEVVCEAAAITTPDLVVGLDADAEMLEAARLRSEQLGLQTIRYQRAHMAGEGSSGFNAGQFDHVWARFFLEYQLDALAVVKEMTRIARPGGRVTLIDIDGNCAWHYPLPRELRAGLDAVLADLASTGFDPYVGSKLSGYATAAGLIAIRESIEPYHYVVGRPDPAVADTWRRKADILRHNYLTRLFPDRQKNAWVFDALLEFILSENTMTWSMLHLVQGTRAAEL